MDKKQTLFYSFTLALLSVLAFIYKTRSETSFYQWLENHYTQSAIHAGVVEKTRKNDAIMFTQLSPKAKETYCQLFTRIETYIEQHGLNINDSLADIRFYLEERMTHFDRFILPLLKPRYKKQHAAIQKEFICQQLLTQADH